MNLVIEQLPLLRRPGLIGELPAADGIASGDERALQHYVCAALDNRKSSLAHYHVEEAWVCFQLEFSLASDLREA